MSDQSAIEWTDATWNPIIGCSRVSEGCRNCYAERTAIRQATAPPTYPVRAGMGRYHGLVKSTPSGPRWTGEVRLMESVLDAPLLRWKSPRRIFVNSMGDLFHEKVDNDWIDRVFAVMVAAPQHTYQILTKRPERMLAYMSARQTREHIGGWFKGNLRQRIDGQWLNAWPPERVWLGVSVEDQATADERILSLLRTPAAIRWVSYEPALGPVDFRAFMPAHGQQRGFIDWLVVGGESGPGARPFDLAWARSTVAQGKAAGVPVFVKQIGSKPYWRLGPETMEAAYAQFKPKDRKGGDPSEWPEDLRVREYPR